MSRSQIARQPKQPLAQPGIRKHRGPELQRRPDLDLGSPRLLSDPAPRGMFRLLGELGLPPPREGFGQHIWQ
eukprot:12145174-Alexandrium_andersonii.AAC.1